MGTLYRDMSSLAPAPTLKRETAALAANAVVVVAFFAAIILLLDGSRVLNAAIGGAVLAVLVGRWLYVAKRGDSVGR